MKILSAGEFDKWLADNAMFYDPEGQLLTFRGEEYVFRIPIGDYVLQLDRRIEAAFKLLPADRDLLLCRKDLEWRNKNYKTGPLQVALHHLGITAASGVIHVVREERQLAFVISYLTNRWGTSSDSMYIFPDSTPGTILFFCGSPESVFVICRTKAIHDDCVSALTSQAIPAYGRNVEAPIPEPTYDDISLGQGFVKVNRETGKPIGAGSDESALLPEFLPPWELRRTE